MRPVLNQVVVRHRWASRPHRIQRSENAPGISVGIFEELGPPDGTIIFAQKASVAAVRYRIGRRSHRISPNYLFLPVCHTVKIVVAQPINADGRHVKSSCLIATSR